MENFPSGEQKNEGSKERNEKWEAARKDVEHIVDGLGLGIDEKIKDTVATLRAMGFETDSSCAGHAEPEEGIGFPYVRFYTPPPENWKTDERQRKAWTESNRKQREKFIPLLKEFNSVGQRTEDAILIMRDIGLFAAFKVESAGVKKFWSSRNEAIEAIRLYQKEMNEFTEFLKGKFLGKQR